MSPRSCILTCGPLALPWLGNDANFGDFGIMTPLDGHVLP